MGCVFPCGPSDRLIENIPEPLYQPTKTPQVPFTPRTIKKAESPPLQGNSASSSFASLIPPPPGQLCGFLQYWERKQEKRGFQNYTPFC